MAQYTLPDLGYDYGALDPHIAGAIMELHHSKHHAAYVAGANTALDQLAEARETGNFASVAGVERALAFNLGGHINHSIFWTNLSPDGGDKPVGALAAAIDNDFGSFDKFAAHFTANSLAIFGSGWSILAWDTLSKKLIIVQLYDQQGNVPVTLIPVLMLDMWEHAFYLQYKNVKADYVKAWWNVIDWANVGARFDAAQDVKSVIVH